MHRVVLIIPQGMVLLLIAFVSVFVLQPQAQQVIYTNNFDQPVGLEWSSNQRKRAVTPLGKNNFLGRFASESALLTLTNIPQHNYLTVEYDLYLIDAWDGNGSSASGGPDIFTVKELGGNTLMRTSFSTHSLTNKEIRTQSFPGSYPQDNFEYASGATFLNSLGYTNWVARFGISSFGAMVTNESRMYWKPKTGVVKEAVFDCVYHMRHAIVHSADSVRLYLTMASSENNINDESWGIDNISVVIYSEDNIPPPTFLTTSIPNVIKLGDSIRLSATPEGFGPFAFQWLHAGTNIPSATNLTLRLDNITPQTTGQYQLMGSNLGGTNVSDPIIVSLLIDDSDNDGLSDADEALIGTNPNSPDSDVDGLTDFDEAKTYSTNPLNTDTDGDGYSDAVEVLRGGNPNDRNIKPNGALAVFPAVDVEFFTANGVKYQLEMSTDMLQWISQGSVVVGNGGTQNHLVRANKTTSFWRLKVVP